MNGLVGAILALHELVDFLDLGQNHLPLCRLIRESDLHVAPMIKRETINPKSANLTGTTFCAKSAITPMGKEIMYMIKSLFKG
jgi:hypothetical protein